MNLYRHFCFHYIGEGRRLLEDGTQSQPCDDDDDDDNDDESKESQESKESKISKNLMNLKN